MARRAIWARRLSRLGLRPPRAQRDARPLQEFELLEVAQDGLRRVGDGGAAEPGQRGPSTEGIGDEQAVERSLGVVGQDRGQDAIGLVLGLLLGGDHHPFQTGQPRPHDLVGAQLLTGELEKQGQPVMLQGPGDEPGLEGAQVAGPGLAKAKMDQDFLEVTRPGLGPLPVLGEASWVDTELLGRDDRWRPGVRNGAWPARSPDSEGHRPATRSRGGCARAAVLGPGAGRVRRA